MIILEPLLCTLLFIGISLLGLSRDFHTNSLISLVLTMTILLTLNSTSKDKLGIQKVDKLVYDKFLLKILNKKIILIFLLIVILNATINILGFYFLQEKLDYSLYVTDNFVDNIKNYVLVSTTLSILMAQIGGLFLQTVLIFCVSILLDVDLEFKGLTKVVITSYLGFLTTSIILLLLNFYLFNKPVINKDAIEGVLKGSLLTPTIGKFGEYLTLSLINCMLMNKNVPFSKSVIISFIPSVLILGSIQIFKYAF